MYHQFYTNVDKYNRRPSFIIIRPLGAGQGLSLETINEDHDCSGKDHCSSGVFLVVVFDVGAHHTSLLVWVLGLQVNGLVLEGFNQLVEEDSEE